MATCHTWGINPSRGVLLEHFLRAGIFPGGFQVRTRRRWRPVNIPGAHGRPLRSCLPGLVRDAHHHAVRGSYDLCVSFLRLRGHEVVGCMFVLGALTLFFL